MDSAKTESIFFDKKIPGSSPGMTVLSVIVGLDPTIS